MWTREAGARSLALSWIEARGRWWGDRLDVGRCLSLVILLSLGAIRLLHLFLLRIGVLSLQYCMC
ncbi:hypothetical protein BD311DRAFT_747368 [Dichomitus squalens]|uniref:Uncharacterized protein n=1 Tax=Dichomitus squalens TaxID=114155 RepID=A0A4Q9N5T8_9APHY|nr:hypothetical protein BD311DRAFT_747368 [Dichomitus squalens]